MKKVILPALIVVLSGSTAFAQRFLGVATGNYNSLNSLYINPANIAGSSEKLAVSLFSMNIGVDNSLGTISAVSDIGKTTGSNDSGISSIFTPTNNSKFSMMVPVVEVRGPGVLYSINSRNTLALTTRLRAFNEFNNFDKTLYNTITNTSTAQSGLTVNTQNFNWTAHAWAEIGLTYGVVAVDNENFQVKAGITLRYLGGVGYLGLKGKNLDLQYTAGSDSLHATNSDLEFASNIASSQDAFTNGVSAGTLIGNAFSGNSGKGFGTDLGVSFIYKPDGHNGYKAAVGLSVTDLGFINYKTSYTVNVTGNGYITGSGIAKSVKDFNDFKAYINAHGYNGDTGVKATKVYLPTAFIISGDYNAWKRIYINAMIITNMVGNDKFGSMYYSQFSLTPRFDSKIFSFGLPLTYSMLTHNMRMGMGFRVSGFYIGSDDMLALFSKGQYGFNFYLGAMVPIYKKHKSTEGSDGIRPWKS